MDKFTIRAELLTPAIVSTLTLDGLLGSVLFDDLQDVDKAHASIPIQCSLGLFHASAAMPVGEVEEGKCALIAGLRATHDLDVSLIKQDKKGRPHRHIGLTRRSDFGNVMNGYRTVTAATIQWHAVGDAEHVLHLLHRVEFIGKKRTAGFGQVSGWRLLRSELDGIADANRLPLRPVPIERWTGRSDAVRADAAWKPAYWLPQHRAICAVPKDFVA